MHETPFAKLACVRELNDAIPRSPPLQAREGCALTPVHSMVTPYPMLPEFIHVKQTDTATITACTYTS